MNITFKNIVLNKIDNKYTFAPIEIIIDYLSNI